MACLIMDCVGLVSRSAFSAPRGAAVDETGNRTTATMPYAANDDETWPPLSPSVKPRARPLSDFSTWTRE